ncbi:MAG: mechanosensitive ion channel [Spirochaeta sp.]|nr:mechanosensitive ion channel [Spirochaeta sp.]
MSNSVNNIVQAAMSILDLLRFELHLAGQTLPFTPLDILLSLIVPLALVIVLARIIQPRVARAVRRLLIRSVDSHERREHILKWGRRVYRLMWILFLFALVGQLFGAQIIAYLVILSRIFTEPFYSAGSTDISLMTLLLLVPLFWFASWFSSVTRKTAERTLFTRMSMDAAQRFSFASLLRYAVMGLVIIIGLSLLGINLSSVAVVFGVFGIGIGFGLQHVIANFFSGMIIVFTRPIKEGDRIQINEFEGTVESIRVVSTVVNTIANETLIIPNSYIVNNAMHNYSFDDRRIVVKNPVHVAYSADLDKAIEIMLEIGDECLYRVPGKEPLVRVSSFDDSSITLLLLTWIQDTQDKYASTSWMNLEIWRRFRAQGVEIPFPQRDLHIRSSAVDFRVHPAD